MNELEKLKEHKIIKLVDYLSDGSYRLKPNILPNTGAVYVFWWTGSISDFVNDGVNRVIRFKGPNGRPVDVEFSDDWIERIQIDGKIPLEPLCEKMLEKVQENVISVIASPKTGITTN